MGQKIFPVPQPLAEHARVVVHHGVSGDGFAPDMVIREESRETPEELRALGDPPRHAFEIQSGQVVGRQEGQDFRLGTLLREIFPGSGVSHGQLTHHLEGLGLGLSERLPIQRQDRGRVGVIRGLRRVAGEIEVVLHFQRRIGLQPDGLAVGGATSLEGQGTQRNLGQHVRLHWGRTRIADHDLRAIRHARQELVVDELVVAFLSLEQVAVIQSEEAFAEEQFRSRGIRGARARWPHFTDKNEQGAVGGEGSGTSLVADRGGVGGLEGQVENCQGQQDFAEVVVGLEDTRREEGGFRIPCGKVAPETRDRDQVGALGLEGQPVVLILRPFLGRPGGTVIPGGGRTSAEAASCVHLQAQRHALGLGSLHLGQGGGFSVHGPAGRFVQRCILGQQLIKSGLG